jgi:hypothetical protein
MKLKALVFIMAVLGLTNVYSNEIYIDQVGDSSTVTIIQDGTGNKVGDSAIPAFIGGGSNVVNIQQIGIGNELAMIVNGAATEVVVDTTGSNNIQTISCGTTTSASCSSSTIKQVVVGDSNIITQSLGTGANHYSEINVTGSTNTITHTSTSVGASTVNVNAVGDTNTIGVTQSGTTAQTVTVNSTGSGNNISINQSN